MLASLTDERSITGEDEVQQTARIFREALPQATQAIVHTALYSDNDKLRLEAARYVVERNLGGLAHVNPATGTDNPWEALLGDVVSEMEEEHVQNAERVLATVEAPSAEEGE
jgi:hypothetical protein